MKVEIKKNNFRAADKQTDMWTKPFTEKFSCLKYEYLASSLTHILKNTKILFIIFAATTREKLLFNTWKIIYIQNSKIKFFYKFQ